MALAGIMDGLMESTPSHKLEVCQVLEWIDLGVAAQVTHVLVNELQLVVGSQGREGYGCDICRISLHLHQLISDIYCVC